MLLAIDVGNTTTVLAVSELDGARWSATWRLSSDRARTPDDWAATVVALASSDGVRLSDVSAVVVASVVPVISASILGWCRGRLHLEPLVVSAALELGVELDVETPFELGADRICSVVAAWELVRDAVVVVDAGTATKVEAVSSDGVYRGGAIAVGLGLSLEALAGRAALLYGVPLSPSARVAGRNTIEAIQGGIVNGHAHMVAGLVADVSRELGGAGRVLLSGGYSPILSPLLPHAELVPDLTLDGLRLIHRRNTVAPEG